jgi:hypothetical protein
MKFKTLITCFIWSIVFTSCSHNRLDIDVSDIKTNSFKFIRLDSLLWAWSLNTQDAETALNRIQNLGSAQRFALSSVIPIDSLRQIDAQRRVIQRYIKNPDISAALRRIHNLYTPKQIGRLKSDIDNLFKHYAYYFPKDSIPHIVSFCSGWNYAFAPYGNNLILSLDMYLGDTCSLYKFLPFPKYQISKMSPEYIVSDLARALLLIKTDRQQAADFLLAHAVFYGKLFYGIKALIPKTDDRLILGYTSDHMKYLSRYEHELWSYFATDNKWFVQDLKVIRAHITEGPFTAAISKECPPRIAMWVGYRMVTAFMNRNPKISLDSLYRIQDPNRILRESAYRP